MSEFAVRIKDLTKVYNLYGAPLDRLKEALHPFGKKYHEQFYALKGVNIDIRRGESVGIIGMNGSGKSTLLKTIAGIITPHSGSVEVHGRISALLELGAGFNPEFTGQENAEFHCSMQGYSRDKTKELLKSIVEFAEIGEFIHQPVKTYSSGMYVRLAFAVAINVDPDILIVDEALAVGDAYFQVKCMHKIKAFMKAGKTLIFVSHDPGAVKTICSKAYLLKNGTLVDSGEPEQVFNFYNSLLAEKEFVDASTHLREALRKRSGNRKIEILDVAMLNSRQQPVELFVSGEEVTINIRLAARDAVTDLTVGILIRDRLGSDIFGTNNALMDQTIDSVQKDEEFMVTYKFHLNLGPNLYALTVAAHTQETHIIENFDWINNISTFKVVPSSDLRFLGYCRLLPEFAWSKIGDGFKV